MQQTLAKLKRGEHVTIVALGDSITEVTFHTQGRMNWVGLLEEALFEEYGKGVCTLINSGICGDSYRNCQSRLERDVLRFEPDLVILALGMNDPQNGRDGLPAFRENVRSVVSRIRESGKSEILIRTPNPIVTVHGTPLPKEQPCPGRPWEPEERALEEYAAALVLLSDELECSCVDHYTLWKNREFQVKHPVADPTGLWPRMGDAIHPGYLGHLAFFRELAPLFQLSPYFPWEEVVC
jgi:lysophospholipase L1-like esterase